MVTICCVVYYMILNFLFKPIVMSGEQLIYSDYLQSLCSFCVALRLDNILCYTPLPPNHRQAMLGKFVIHFLSNYNRNIKLFSFLKQVI